VSRDLTDVRESPHGGGVETVLEKRVDLAEKRDDGPDRDGRPMRECRHGRGERGVTERDACKVIRRHTQPLGREAATTASHYELRSMECAWRGNGGGLAASGGANRAARPPDMCFRSQLPRVAPFMSGVLGGDRRAGRSLHHDLRTAARPGLRRKRVLLPLAFCRDAARSTSPCRVRPSTGPSSNRGRYATAVEGPTSASDSCASLTIARGRRTRPRSWSGCRPTGSTRRRAPCDAHNATASRAAGGHS
jgi:hypothetical protein